MTPRCLQCGIPLIPYEEISLCNVCQYAEEPPARDEETISTVTLAELRAMHGDPLINAYAEYLALRSGNLGLTETQSDPFKTEGGVTGLREEMRDAIISAYIAGATDVHNNWQEDRNPDFTEAAHDYASACVDDAPVDSGMSGDAVERAELFWANLPTGRPWTSLATHEVALVCHQVARMQSGEAA